MILPIVIKDVQPEMAGKSLAEPWQDRGKEIRDGKTNGW
jgi:hypothetical protein